PVLPPWSLGPIALRVVFGSILVDSAYTYPLRHAPPSIVGTYAYVNPVIAVLLGWLILKEPVTTRTFIAMAMILGAVVWIQFSHGLRRMVGRSDSETEQTSLGNPSDRPTVRPTAEEART